MSEKTAFARHGLPVVVIGAGGHAKVVIELLRAEGWSVVACTDADASPRSILGVPVVGTDHQLGSLRKQGITAAFVALGGNALRETIGMRLIELGFSRPNAISPDAMISPSVSIGCGVAVMAGAVVNADASIGDFAIINTRASVDHDNVIGNAAHVGPGCSLAGCVGVGERTFLGAGSTVIPGVTLGRDCMIGAGSVVVRDMPDGVKAFGVPARTRSRD